MIYKDKKMALVGDAVFPQTRSRQRMVQTRAIAKSIIRYSPSVVYLCPTKGVNLSLVPFLVANHIPFVYIIPSKNFFCTLTPREKKVFEVGAKKAQRVIRIDDAECLPLRWFSDWEAASHRAVDSSDWVLMVHNQEETSEGFYKLLGTFVGSKKPTLALDLGLAV
jgi:hypothetical protein